MGALRTAGVREATAVAGMLLRTEVVGLALIAGSALCAICAWYALGAPVRRRDIAREITIDSN
jgi:hypothetical protein